MNKKQQIVVLIAGAILIVITINLFLLDGRFICRPLYDLLYPMVHKMDLITQFFNTVLPIVVIAGLLIYLLRKK